MTQALKVAIIGCVRFSRSMFEALAIFDGVELCGVVTRSRSVVNSDHVDLSDVAARLHIPVLDAEGKDQDDLARWLTMLGADLIFCLGWSFLLKQKVLDSAPKGVIGYHPALLPRNRGRHPIIWALALGLPETGSTFFQMDAGTDSGPILSQRRVAITSDDDASSLYVKLESIALDQICDLVRALRENRTNPVAQPNSLATYWRKRSKADGRIDWRMDSTAIHNLVRALVPPYPRAHFEFRGEEAHVWKTRVGEPKLLDVEPGFVFSCADGVPHVQCGMGTTIHLECHDLTANLSAGDYL